LDCLPGEAGPFARSGQSAVSSRIIRFMEGAYWRFGLLFQIVRRDLADRPPGHLRPSASGTADCLSHLLIELHFRVALSLGLFLWLVGPL
jgi:hypothetical protein